MNLGPMLAAVHPRTAVHGTAGADLSPRTFCLLGMFLTREWICELKSSQTVRPKTLPIPFTLDNKNMGSHRTAAVSLFFKFKCYWHVHGRKRMVKYTLPFVTPLTVSGASCRNHLHPNCYQQPKLQNMRNVQINTLVQAATCTVHSSGGCMLKGVNWTHFLFAIDWQIVLIHSNSTTFCIIFYFCLSELQIQKHVKLCSLQFCTRTYIFSTKSKSKPMSQAILKNVFLTAKLLRFFIRNTEKRNKVGS